MVPPLSTGSSMLGPTTHALHARLAPAEALVDERRALYRLAVDLFAPGAGMSDNLLDHPIVRYEIGKALAGHGGLDLARLHEVAEMRIRDVGVAVAADPRAAELLGDPLRIVAPQDTAPQPLTEADGERFDAAVEIVAKGVQLFRRLAPATADDLLPHVSMLAVLKGETSGGVVSASSRYVPGIVLIDEPATPIEVVEALVHEGAHEKFFELAITREFLDSHAEEVEEFENSWSHARWPLEQTFAAWHAYSCLAQFAEACDGEQLGPVSLLPKARERADEIGSWLIAHEDDLRQDARWLLRALAGESPAARSDVHGGAFASIRGDARFRVVPDVHYRQARSGRVVAGRRTDSPLIFWLDDDASWVLHALRQDDSFDRLQARARESWAVDDDVAGRRLRTALGSLVTSSIVEATS